ncbi:YafY family transcriptional regulator [Rhodohalobacter mucosus]|uniref:YafY family transcriptional regulator n=1 Tax=Rhodohalobacter mucosus TaxID=2079485 RepID=A0A316TRX8_9BACT|nr:YafY family transcriptional regulator [Rhodohalobacter mucosus]
MLMLQQSKKRITVDKLADMFNVSRRTIFRDFNALSDLKVPVTWDEFNGYGIMEGYKIPPLMFTTEELATIMVGLNFVKSQVDKKLAEDAKGVELKIKEVVNDELRNFMDSLENKTVVDPFLHFGHEKKDGGNWYIVSSAISRQKSLRFVYRSKGDSTETERLIDPYLIVFYKDHWNVIGYSHKRAAIRNFVLDRMSGVEITDQKFELKSEINAEALIFNSNESGQKIEVLVGKEAERAFMANLPTKIIRKEAINSKKIKVEFRFESLDYLNDWLLQFGDKVTVLSPKQLIRKRERLISSMMENLHSS